MQWHDLSAKHQTFEQWFDSDLGDYFQTQISTKIIMHLKECFGVHRVHIGPGAYYGSALPAPMSRTLVIGVDQMSQIIANPLDLPLANSSVQALVIHFLFDIAKEPHELLREAARVIMPGGKVIICGLNPNCLWGLRYNLHGRLTGIPSMSPRRLKDWLTLLDFRMTKLDYCCHRLINNRQKFIKTDKISYAKSSLFSPLGAVYVMSAVKHEGRFIGRTTMRKNKPKLSFAQVVK